MGGRLQLELRVLCYRSEAGNWIAQGLEKDIAAQGRTLSEVRHAFAKTLACNALVAEELGDAEMMSIAPAPQRFFDRWNSVDSALREPFASDSTADLPAWLVNAVREMRIDA